MAVGASSGLGGIEGSKVNLNNNATAAVGQESTSDMTLFKQIDSYDMSVQHNNYGIADGMGSGLKQPRMKKMTSHGQKISGQNPL